MLRQQLVNEIPFKPGSAPQVGGPKSLTRIRRSQRQNGNARRPEIELLVNCGRTRLNATAKHRINEILTHQLNWNEVLDRAAKHAIVPLLNRSLNHYPDLVPPDILKRLRALTYKSNIHNLYLAAELSRLVKLMKQNGITPLPFKGPILAAVAYGDLSLRQFGDLDILIPKRHFQKAKELFVASGYLPLIDRTAEQETIYLQANRPYNYKFVTADGRVRIELHWEFTSRYNSFDFDYDGLNDRLGSVEFAGHQVQYLKPEDLLLTLSQHGSKHFWTRLLWLVDIVEVLRMHPGLDWQTTIMRAEGMGIRRMLFLALRLAERLFDLELPLEVSKKIRKEPKIKDLVWRIEEQIFFDSRAVQGFEAHRFSCLMRERARDKFRYSGYRVLHYVSKGLTPTDKDRRALPPSLRSSPLAYVLRPPRLLLKGASNLLKRHSAKSRALSKARACDDIAKKNVNRISI